MIAEHPDSSESWREELEALLVRLRDETLLHAMLWLFALGLALLGLRLADDPSQSSLLALAALCLLALVAWAAYRRYYLVASWALILGMMALILLVTVRGGVASAVWLIALPVGLATLTISSTAGFSLAALCSLALTALPPPWLPVPGELRVTALVGIWGLSGMIWLALRCIVTSVRWMWSGYEKSHALLEQLRDNQLLAKQTLEDLAAANLQLTRLNQLAAGLRVEAEEARRAKEQFVANVSHELRTPLNMIIGFSEMIVRSPQTYGRRRLPPALLADLEVVRRNAQQLSGLVNDVLDLSQIEARQMALRQEQCSLPEIVEAAVTAVRPLYASKGLELRVTMSGDLPPVHCDRLRIREVILNLLSNAGRFTEHGGVQVTAEARGGETLVCVSDTGPGIAAEDLKKLFEPFWQADPTVAGRRGGSGLGLSISRSFVELHGGRMWCESEQGAGSRLFFTLPLQPEVPSQIAAHQRLVPHWDDLVRTRKSQAPILRPKPQFLVMDESGLLQRLVNRYLADAEVMSIASLEQAITTLSGAPAQAVIINSVRPVESEVWRARLPSGTPVITCFLPSTPEAAERMGVADYLVKPITAEALLGALDRLPLPPTTVLLVDDEPDALQLFWRMLESSGRNYRVLTAGDGEQALHLMRRQQPDVVLLDLTMPNVDGFHVLAARREDAALRDMPCIVTSARDPNGHPVVSDGISVTQAGGLALPEALDIISAVSAILSPLSHSAGQALPERSLP